MRRVLVPAIALFLVMTAGCSAFAAEEGTAPAVLAAINLADVAGFHGMDETLNGATPAINAQWLGATRKARIAAAAIEWPEELRTQATSFVDACARLQAALEQDDVNAAKEPAHDVHETQHELSSAAYNYLASKAGIATPAPSEE